MFEELMKNLNMFINDDINDKKITHHLQRCVNAFKVISKSIYEDKDAKYIESRIKQLNDFLGQLIEEHSLKVEFKILLLLYACKDNIFKGPNAFYNRNKLHLNKDVVN